MPGITFIFLTSFLSFPLSTQSIIYCQPVLRNLEPSIQGLPFLLICSFDLRRVQLGGFIGYPALVRQRTEGIRKRLVQFVIEDHNIDEDPWPWSGEPIYRNNVFCGFVTSTAFGFGLNRHICLGYVHDYDPATKEPRLMHPNEFIVDKSARFEINIAGHKFPARASLYAPILPSPSSFRVRS